MNTSKSDVNNFWQKIDEVTNIDNIPTNVNDVDTLKSNLPASIHKSHRGDRKAEQTPGRSLHIDQVDNKDSHEQTLESLGMSALPHIPRPTTTNLVFEENDKEAAENQIENRENELKLEEELSTTSTKKECLECTKLKEELYKSIEESEKVIETNRSNEEELQKLREKNLENEAKVSELIDEIERLNLSLQYRDKQLDSIFDLTQKRQFSNGKYVGQCFLANEEKIPHGYGFWKVSEGDLNIEYKGKFEQGKKCGYGVLIKSKAPSAEKKLESYEGYQKNDKRNGKGTFKNFLNGVEYQGNQKDDKRQGFGEQKTFKETSILEKYVGNQENDKKEGEGKFFYMDGSVYDGEQIDGLSHGHGRLISADKTEEYVGNFEQGLQHGNGCQRGKDGESYEGDQKHGRKSGKGVWKHNEGQSYNGMFDDDRPHGNGVLEYFDGTKYDGEQEYGQRNGEGTYEYACGDRYVGGQVQGMASGKGIYEFADGALFDGSQTKGQPHGEGKFKFPDGKVIERVWHEHLPRGYVVKVPQQKSLT